MSHRPRSSFLVALGLLAAITGLAATARAQDGPHPLDDRVALEREAVGDEAGALEFYLQRLDALWGAPGKAGETAAVERVLCEVYLHRAEALARTQGWERLAASLERLAGRPAAPELEGLRDWILARQLLRCGRSEDARARFDRLGFLRAWRIVGPFDNEAGRGFHEVHPPETDPALDGTFDGDVRKVSWRVARADEPAGALNLDAHFRPNDEVLAYALTFVRAEATTPAVLRLGSDEGVKVWLNGVLVHAADVHRELGFDQDRIPVMLAPGWNRLLIQVAEAKESWGLRARLTDPAGAPLAALEHADAPPAGVDPAGAKLPPGAAAPPALPDDAVTLLTRRAQAHPEDPRLHFHRGILTQASHAEDRVKSSHAKHFANAVLGEPQNPHYRYFLALALKEDVAMSAEREENRIRQELEEALRLFPRHAAAARELAWYYSRTTINLHKALRYAESAVRIGPDNAISRVLYAELLKAGGLSAPAEVEAQETARRLPDHPLVLAREAQRSAERGRLEEAAALYRRAVTADPLNANARLGYVEVLLRRGRADEAMAQFDAILAIDPTALAAYVQKVRLEESRGRWAEAAAELRKALAICPEDDALLTRLGTIELQEGRTEAGIERLQEALRLNPNNINLREYVQTLAGAEQSFEKPYRVDPQTVLAGRPKGLLPPGRGATCLLHNEAVRLNRDGTRAHWQQRFFVITSTEGVRDFDYVGIPYVAGEQKLSVLSARVHHPDGTRDDARLERAGGAGRGEDRQWRRFPVDLPVLNVGDVVEVEHLIEDLEPTFFGDYFGDVVTFGLGYEVADFRYTLVVPKGRPIYLRPVNLAVEPERETTPDGRYEVRRWRLRDLPGVEPEPDMPPIDQAVPSLEISTFPTWQAFATWYSGLIRKQFEVDDAIRAKVRELTEARSSEMERIRAIYNWVLSDIRYVAWEFGVHGYQPYPATQIFHRRFGDCKDKALLINVMLGEIGIRARPVLIYAEEKRGHLDLPFPLVERFNHCISQVTLADGRVIYLDGTATFHGMNTLPSMDQGAPVLVVDEKGGSIASTPLGSPADNVREEALEVVLAADAPAHVVGRVMMTGPRASEVRWRYSLPEKRSQVLERDLTAAFGEVRVEKTEFANLMRMEQPVHFAYSAALPALVGARSGGRLALRPSGQIHRLSDSCTLGQRKHDLLLEVPWRDVERVRLRLPEGWRPAATPEPVRLETPFGLFAARVVRDPDGRHVSVEKELELRVTRVKAADYAAYRAFCNAVDAWESQEILLER